MGGGGFPHDMRGKRSTDFRLKIYSQVMGSRIDTVDMNFFCEVVASACDSAYVD